MPKLSTYLFASMIVTIASSIPYLIFGTIFFMSFGASLDQVVMRVLLFLPSFLSSTLAFFLVIASPIYAASLYLIYSADPDLLRGEIAISVISALVWSAIGFFLGSSLFSRGVVHLISWELLLAFGVAIYNGLIWGTVFKMRRPKSGVK